MAVYMLQYNLALQVVYYNINNSPYDTELGDDGGALVTHSPPTSEIGGSNPKPCVGKMVVSCLCSAIYSTEP